jgi:hypothetical protein
VALGGAGAQHHAMPVPPMSAPAAGHHGQQQQHYGAPAGRQGAPAPAGAVEAQPAGGEFYGGDDSEKGGWQ